jgi:hypothetical protein
MRKTYDPNELDKAKLRLKTTRRIERSHATQLRNMATTLRAWANQLDKPEEQAVHRKAAAAYESAAVECVVTAEQADRLLSSIEAEGCLPDDFDSWLARFAERLGQTADKIGAAVQTLNEALDLGLPPVA